MQGGYRWVAFYREGWGGSPSLGKGWGGSSSSIGNSIKVHIPIRICGRVHEAKHGRVQGW